MRRVCAISAVVGMGTGSHLAIITLPAGMQEKAISELGETLFAYSGFIRSSLLTPDAALSTPLPKELTENRQLLPMLLLESSSVEASQRLAAHACHALDCSSADVLHYGFGWQLTAQELKS